MYLSIVHQLTGNRIDFKSKRDLNYWIDCHRSLNVTNASRWIIYRNSPGLGSSSPVRLCSVWDYKYNNFKFKY